MTQDRPASEGEYVFRYRVQPDGEEPVAPLYEDRLLEMVRRQFENLLNVIVPVYRGKEVKIDGFKLLSDLDTVYDIFPREGRGRQLT